MIKQESFSTDKLKYVIENMMDCFAYLTAVRDCNGNIMDFYFEYINQASCAKSKRTKNDIEGKRLLEIFPEYKYTNVFDKYCQIIETGEPLILEKANIYGEASDCIFQVQASKVGDGIVAMWREVSKEKVLRDPNTTASFCDVKERRKYEEKVRESEETIRAMLNSITEAIVLCDLDGMVQTINETGAKRYYRKPEELINKCIYNFMPEDLAKKRKLLVDKNIRAGKSIHFYDQREDMDLDNVMYPVFNANGQVIKFVAFTQDITERKKSEAELARKNEELKVQRAEAIEANKLKSQFLANMSHELRTPLNSIIGFTTRVIKKGGNILPPIQLDNLKIVKKEAQHLLELINSLLDYSKTESGKMEVHLEEFNLIEVVNEVNSMVETLLEGKIIKYELDLFSINYIPIISDRIKVKQILINLLSNAIKYSEKGTIKLSVKSSNPFYCIKVLDEGIGIAVENIDNIFDEFRQIDGSYTRKVGGTGLGLSITKKFVEMLGGRIEVTSTLGVGSCFSLFLPIEVSNTKKDEIEVLLAAKDLTNEEKEDPKRWLGDKL